MIYSDDGNRAGNKISKEYKLEADMTRKQRIRETDTDRIRNEIGVATKVLVYCLAFAVLLSAIKQGDKAYRIADHEADYFAKGGLVPGSTIALKKSAKPIMKSTLAMTNAEKKATISFSDKVRNSKMSYERNLINSLTVSTSLLHFEITQIVNM
jgi:hypothetical protein